MVQPAKNNKRHLNLRVSPQAFILFLSALVALTIFAVSAPFNLGDSNTYLNFADDIVHLHGPTRPERTFGYAILLVLSLYTKTHSLMGILLLQAAMSVGITWFIFKICACFSVRFAFVMSLLAILSLIPYNYQPVIFHDQSQLFFLLFLASSLFAFTESPSYRTAFILLLSYDILTCFRPTFGVLLPVILLNFFIVSRKDTNRFRYVKLIVLMLLSISVIHIAAQAINVHFLNQLNDKTYNKTTAGVQIFDNVYRLSKRIPDAFTVGEGTSQFRQVLLNHFSNSKNNLADFDKVKHLPDEDYQRYFSKYKTQPDKLVDAILKNPSKVHYWFLVNLIRSELGDREADHLFLKTALEQYHYHPIILFLIIKDGLYGYILNYLPQGIQYYPTNWYKHSKEELNALMNASNEKIFYANPPLNYFFDIYQFSPFMISFDRSWSSFYSLFHETTVVGAILGFCFSLIFLGTNKNIGCSKEMFFMINIGLIYLSYIIPMLLFVDSQFRYHMTGALLLFMICGIAIRTVILVLSHMTFLSSETKKI